MIRLGLGVLFVILLILVASVVFVIGKVPAVFSVVIPTSNEDLELTHFDFKDGRAVVLTVPSDTEVNLAMRRGTLRARSVTRLIELEGLPGQILSDTVMKTLYLPVDYWAKEKKYGTYLGGDIPLTVRLAIFIQNLGGLRKENINLKDTSVLVNSRLKDGEDGYIVSGHLPLSLLSLFADPEISSGQTAVRLVNGMGEGEAALAPIAAILEVLGAKPVPPVNVDKSDTDCIVRAKDKYKLARVASVFNCEVSTDLPEAFDVELVLGRRFFERF